MMITVQPATADDIPVWVALRSELWPTAQPDTLTEECWAMLDTPHEVAFIAYAEDGEAIGLIEGSLRGTLAKSYGHIEGWYVQPAYRHHAVGGELMHALENWFLHHSIGLFCSDTSPDYPLSPRAHSKYGYEEVSQIRIFMKKL